MIFSTSCSNRFRFALLTAALLLSGCVGLSREPAWTLQLHNGMPSPQPALHRTVRWTAAISGEHGELSFEFRSQRDGIESIVQQGKRPHWDWLPNRPGSYRVKVRVRDNAGHLVESSWSDQFLITPALNNTARIAVLPAENLSDAKAPLEKISQLLSSRLQDGFSLLPGEELERFMRNHRMRYTGGIGARLAQALHSETGTEAVFISSLETWRELSPPRLSLIARVVTTTPIPRIVWMDSVGLVGDEYPGLLGLGRIDDVQVLLKQGVERLLASFYSSLSGAAPSYRHQGNRLKLLNPKSRTADEFLDARGNRFAPQFFYRSSDFDPVRHYSVAVVPFMNINARKHAGKIISLHMIKQLQRYENLQVFEPGRIREILLKYRMIMQSGPSLAAADVLADKQILDADLIVSGRVFDYQGDIGESKVDFSVQAFDGGKRAVVWTARSYAAGNDGVYFYDWGKIPSAHGLSSRITGTVTKQLLK